MKMRLGLAKRYGFSKQVGMDSVKNVAKVLLARYEQE